MMLVYIYYCRKLDFQANLWEAFSEDKKQHYCGDLVLGWAVLQKTVFNLLVNRVSIKTLEKQPTVFTYLYIDL